ncbi:UNVERIFIED_CONTAM: hypothetical protein GTU68_013388, partial [Idotea baltica]|nr:hypothetical protein [Idotea baltica]
MTWKFNHDFLELLFRNQSSGFFVEAGALDGQMLSNTLWLEKELGWTGLLVEPDSVDYKELLKKERKAWSSRSCLSPTTHPKMAIFSGHSPPKEV